MPELFRNAYWVAEHDPSRQILVVRRTQEPYPNIPTINSAFEQLERSLERYSRDKLRLLVDMRAAPARDDPEFERATFTQPKRLSRGFSRATVVVGTATGRLQIQRSLRNRGVLMPVFQDMSVALKYLTEASDP